MIKVHRGRTRNIEPQVALWRKRKAKYEALKAKLLEYIQSQGWGPDEARAFLHSPHPALSGKTPKQVLSPRTVRLLAKLVKQCHTV